MQVAQVCYQSVAHVCYLSFFYACFLPSGFMSKNASNARTAPVSDAARLRAARTRGRETKANLPLPLSKPENTSEAHKGHSGEHKLGRGAPFGCLLLDPLCD